MTINGEIIQIHVGQAGVQVANACWELYCLEHGITANGCKTQRDNSFNTFFACAPDGRVTPRVLMVDLEPTVIDEIRTGAYRKLFHPNMLITGKEDSGSNYSRGYFTLGSEMIDCTMNNIRLLAEDCQNLQGFMIFRSLGGGTGSGFGNLILEKLLEDYGRKSKLEFNIFPSPNLSPLVVEPYNSILAAHNSIETTECCFLIDNEALYDICSTKLDVQSPTYTNLNRIVGQAVSAFTASQRFQSDINVSFTELQTNLVPYPRLHFAVLSYAPIVSVCRAQLSNYSIREITLGSFEPTNQLVKCSPADGKYMSCVLLYRGDVSPTDINQSIYDIKSRRGIQFVEWSPTGFKIGVNYMPPTYVPGGDIAPTNKAVCMASNTTSIRRPLCTIIEKFSKMMQRRAFVHHYVGEGLEEGTIIDACEDLCSLVGDLTEVSSDAVNDAEVDDEDY